MVKIAIESVKTDITLYITLLKKGAEINEKLNRLGFAISTLCYANRQEIMKRYKPQVEKLVMIIGEEIKKMGKKKDSKLTDDQSDTVNFYKEICEEKQKIITGGKGVKHRRRLSTCDQRKLRTQSDKRNSGFNIICLYFVFP